MLLFIAGISGMSTPKAPGLVFWTETLLERNQMWFGQKQWRPRHRGCPGRVYQLSAQFQTSNHILGEKARGPVRGCWALCSGPGPDGGASERESCPCRSGSIASDLKFWHQNNSKWDWVSEQTPRAGDEAEGLKTAAQAKMKYWSSGEQREEAWQCPDRQSTCWHRTARTAFSRQ